MTMTLECPNCAKRFRYIPTVLDGKEYIECEFCGAELQIDILDYNACGVSMVFKQDFNKGARELQQAINNGCIEIMKKEELIEHWMLLAKTVFVAEDKIKIEWLPKLEASKNASAIVKQQIADAYLRAIATEILDNTNWVEE